MTYKGRTNPKTIERDFPHHVETIVPEGGFGKRLDEMYDWHHARGIPTRAVGALATRITVNM